MPSFNQVTLLGTLTRDPEVKYTPKGAAIASFGMAMNRTYTTEGGEKREEVTFVDCEAFGRQAEIIGEYCKKGKPLFLIGRLKLDQWDDKESGQKRSKLKVVVENFTLIGGKSDGESSEKTARPPARRPPSTPPRPPADPDLDAAADDIPF